MQRGIGQRAQSPGLCRTLSGVLSEAGLQVCPFIGETR